MEPKDIFIFTAGHPFILSHSSFPGVGQNKVTMQQMENANKQNIPTISNQESSGKKPKNIVKIHDKINKHQLIQDQPKQEIIHSFIKGDKLSHESIVFFINIDAPTFSYELS